MEITRLFDIINNQLDQNPVTDSFATKYNGIWEKESTSSMVDKINKVSRGLLKMGIKPDDKIALITSSNRTEWHILDYAIQQIGAISVPIYPSISKEDTIFIINNSETKICFVSDEALYKKIKSIKDSIPNLNGLYTFNEVEKAQNWKEVLDLGEDSSNQYEVESIKSSIKKEDIATIIYTSGTTGSPKGVILSHENIVSNVIACAHILENVKTKNVKTLSFLPICHILERTVTYLYQLKGYSIYFAQSIESIGEDMRDVKPHFFVAVPRLIEKVYAKIYDKGVQNGALKRTIFLWAVRQIENRDINAPKTLAHKIADKLVFKKWREGVGGNIIAIISGSASLSPRLNTLFNGAGIPIVEGYGLTETSPVIAVNNLDKGGIHVGSVGQILKNLTVRLCEDGEIIVKGPSVTKGYYKNPELTQEAFDQDGYFKTGDIGEIKNGFLYITDRKKEMFKTSGGKYIAPQKIEIDLKQSNFIEQVMVVGDGEKMPCAFIQVHYEHVESWIHIKKHNVELTQEAICNSPIVHKRIMKEVDKINKKLGNWEQIKKIELIPTVWSIEGGELTPTLKLKRKFIKEKYKSYYDKMYS